jgi:dipeptidyl aminopeptidase/acylaminoacyl peptidase
VSIDSAAGQSKRPIQIGDLFTMKRISSPALSPDGKWVAYTLTTPDLQNNRSSTDICLSSTDGMSARKLTSNPAVDRNPVWSPDGKSLLFESSRTGENQLWILSLEGGEPRQFTTLATGAMQGIWSPDGSVIAFVSEVYPEFSDKSFAISDSLNRKRLEEQEKSKSRARVYTQLLYRHWDSWNDGRRKHLFVQNVSGGSPRDLTPGDRDAVPTSATFSSGADFAFSPDGREIAYTAAPHPTRIEAWTTNHDIFTVPVGGGTSQQITSNPAADGAPRYSPDGKYLAYRAQSRAGFEADRWQLMVYDRATGTSRSLTATFDGTVNSPAWSPDSRTLFFESEEHGEVPVFAVTIKDSDVRKVLGNNTNDEIQISRDGTFFILTRASAVRPVEIFRCRIDGGALTQVTHVNDTVFASLDLPPPQSVSYPGEGGTPIQAWLFTPPQFDPHRKYPLVMLVHGGPQGAWLNGWSYRWNPPLWAAQGYVIIAPNPRGSTGFGQEFVDQISRDWGGKAFLDLVRGLDYAQSLPYVDKDRTAGAGASFGGYMINWFQARIPERFRTLVCHDGTYNFVSSYGATDEIWFDEWDHAGPPWENPDEFEKFSPHRFAKNFKTPQLIIHGELDFRVPLSEGMQMFTALQRRGIPSKFVIFPDEGHWVLKPANSEFWHTTVFAWLASYLK